MGPYVSGRKGVRARVEPARIKAIQKVQRQPMVWEVKPETIGERMGPKVVAYESRVSMLRSGKPHLDGWTHHHEDGIRSAPGRWLPVHIG